MAKYIDAEAFKRKLIDEKGFFPAIVASALEEMPTADVVEVVRCKDCIYYSRPIRACYHNTFPFHCESRPIMREDDFCSYGERK